jgi:hypothetical protein
VTINPYEVGIEGEAPGHKLMYKSDSPGHWGHTVYFKCTCGQEVGLGTTLRKQDGKVGTAIRRAWRQHLEAAEAATDDAVHVGTVQKKRVKWEVYVISRSHADAQLYARGRYASWMNNNNQANWWGLYNWAVVLDKGGTNKVTANICRSRDEGVEKARRLMRLEAEKGATVTGLEEVPTTLGAVDALSNLLARCEDVEDNLTDLSSMLDELERTLSVNFLLQQRRDEIQARYDKLLGGVT